MERELSSYRSFATVYDMYMDNVPYDKWHDNIKRLLKKYEVNSGTIVDLGCGTGKMTRLLQADGYDMIGVDLSAEMLTEAMSYQAESEELSPIIYVNQPMEELELPTKVDAFVSVCDSINYVTSIEALQDVFYNVSMYLENGIFIFDMNTSFKYKELLGDNTFAENREEGSFIWENYYDEASRINEYDLTLYIANENDSYDRYEEVHFQRAYEVEEIEKLISKAGLKIYEMIDVDTDKALVEETERILFVVGK